MLKILNNSLDGIVLGQKKADFDDVILNNPNYSLEFDRKHKIQSDSELITVSSLRNCDEFCLNGKVINFSNLEKFLEEEDPLIEVSDEENYFYIFPTYNLVLYVDYKDNLFLQILIYDESIRDLYDNKGKKYSDYQKSKLKNPTLNHEKLIFIPYKSIGDFELNCSLSDVIKKYAVDYHKYFSCGPFAMLKALTQMDEEKMGYVSLEERMACGVGACYACVCEKIDGSISRVCYDGPVYDTRELAL